MGDVDLTSVTAEQADRALTTILQARVFSESPEDPAPHKILRAFIRQAAELRTARGDSERDRRRRCAQILIDVIGANGPEDLEHTVMRDLCTLWDTKGTTR
jgi:hypothetical protein